jgi:hypothetical protein
MRHLLVPLAALALVAGCTPDVAPTGSPSVFPSPTVSATPSPTPTPSPSPSAVESFPPAPATESPDQAAIRAAWMEYWRVYEKFAADPSLTDWTETQYVTTEEEAALIIQALGELRDNGWKSLGGRVFRDVVVTEVPNQQEAGTAEISYCLDRSGVSLLDAETGTAVTVDVPPTFLETATLRVGLDGKWRVAMIRNEPAAC